MRILEPKVYIQKSDVFNNSLKKLERYARVCYKSEGSIKNDNCNKFLHAIISRGHESVIEHEKVTVLFVIDRGVSHEIVRHRLASYSQESTRYCNYSNEKFGNEIDVIKPFFFDEDESSYSEWEAACRESETRYLNLISLNKLPEEARSVLPNSLKTEIVVTYNFREWRHFFKLRCAKEAHPQMRQVSIPLLLEFKKNFKVIFQDIEYDLNFPKEAYADIIISDLL